MSIQVVCPNGHPLTVNESCAGRMGLCPVCKAPVKVPQADTRQVSEGAVLDVLGPGKPAVAAAGGKLEGDVPADHAETVKAPKKRCVRCNREIPASLPACPYCHSYLGWK
jgi:hypothetical protein